MKVKLEELKETKIYYEKELKNEELTGGERISFLKALGIIKGFIKREKETREIEEINLLPDFRQDGDHKKIKLDKIKVRYYNRKSKTNWENFKEGIS